MDKIIALGLFLNTVSMQGLVLNLVQEPAVPAQPSYRYEVPFYSQFRDIDIQEWQKLGCGIASLAMLIDFYKPDSVSVMELLERGIDSGVYQKNVGWKHNKLSALAGEYGLTGRTYDFSKSDNQTAFSEFLDVLKTGPAIASIHNKFDPNVSLGHLIAVTGYEEGFIFYNDPALWNGPEKKISVEDFLKGWKKRIIVLS